MNQTLPIYAVLLAAGASTRFGVNDKLLADVGGKPLVAISAEQLIAANLDGVIAVVRCGADGEAVAGAIRHLPLIVTENPSAADGMGTSIACGVAAVPADAAGIMIVPADMPSLDRTLIVGLVAAFRADNGEKIILPVTASGGQRNPVIWPVRLRGDLEVLDAAKGGKALLAAHKDQIVAIAAPDEAAFEDIDTQSDLARVRAQRI